MRKIRAILFDLDGTLLDSNMAEFLPVYLQRLAARVAHILPPERFVPHLLSATQAMVTNDGRATNEEVFAAAFYPVAGHPRAELEPIFLDFYANDYPSLRKLTRRKPEAREVVSLALNLGYDIAIATHPLFPMSAVQQRLAWAGIEDLPYKLVTSYENSRFAKPNLGYFAGICSALGHRPEECLVVGDEEMDMMAANLGCLTFLVPGPATRLRAGTPVPAYRGTLADLARLLNSQPALPAELRPGLNA